jgi:hypothetical protein
MNGPDLRRRFDLGFVLLVFALALVALFLATPLETLNLAPIVPLLQTQGRLALLVLWPYATVAALGAGVGLAELSSTFDDYPRQAIATRWGQYLIWLNGISAVLAFAIAKLYMPADTNQLLLIVGVGAGFPTLIRTKFTVAKQFGGGDDLSINIGWLYDQFQNVCKKQIDLDLMSYRRTQVDRLLARYSTVQELSQTALYTIKARATLTKTEEEVRLADLAQIVDPKVPPELARMNLGLLILELGGVAYVDLLVGAKESAPAIAEISRGGGDEVLAKRLVELSLENLVSLALRVLKQPDDQAWVQAAAQPAPGLGAAQQKAPIAYYVVEHAEPEAVNSELRTQT